MGRWTRFELSFSIVGLHALALTVASVLAGCSAPGLAGSKLSADRAERERVKTDGDRDRIEWLFHQRSYPAKKVPSGAKLRAWQALREAPITPQQAAALAAAGPWLNIGPSPQLMVGSGLPYSNRIEHLAADPGSATHWLVSAPEGGLWETRDAGATWAPRTDDMPSLTTGAVAFASSNPMIVYSGIGEPGVGG